MGVAPFTSDDKPDYFTTSILNYIDTATQDAIIWEHITFGVNLIKDASGNEFVKVVRCKDCKHYKPWVLSRPENGGDCVLNKVEVDVWFDGFCAWGERKGGDAR